MILDLFMIRMESRQASLYLYIFFFVIRFLPPFLLRVELCVDSCWRLFIYIEWNSIEINFPIIPIWILRVIFLLPPFFFCLKDYFIMLLVNYEFNRTTVKQYFFLSTFLRGNSFLTFAFPVESNYVDVMSSEIFNDASTLIFIVDMICRNESHEPSVFIGPTQELFRHPSELNDKKKLCLTESRISRSYVSFSGIYP